MQIPNVSAPGSLSDVDLERLDSLLEIHAVPNDGMSLEMLDGFLSALIVGPESVLPSEFLPVVWNHEPTWDSPEQAEEMFRLIMGLWNDIVARLQIELDEDNLDAHAAAMPLLAYPALDEDEEGAEASADIDRNPFASAPADFPLGAAWALGFLRGVGLRQQAWETWSEENDFVEDDLGMLEALALFSPEQAQELGLDPADIPPFNDRLDLIADLPAMLQDLNMLRLTPKTVRRAETPGRNDPCPCGSGKKFKLCCGAPQNLH